MKIPIVILLLCLIIKNAHLQGLNCYVPADILILLDGSDSIQDRDWTSAKSFVKNLVNKFDIAQDAIHMGIIVYSSNIGDHISFKPFKQKNMLKIISGALRHPKQSTNTAKGIEFARTQFKTSGRPGVPKILIVITDGSSDSPRNTRSQAELAKIEGVRVLAVGVGGHTFKDELRQIASSPRKVYTATSFITLQGLVNEIRNMVCQVITTTTTSTTAMPMPTQPNIHVPVAEGKICAVPGDVVFLIDGSDSINDMDFRRQKNFVANMIDNFEIGKEYIHAGIVVFSTMIGDEVRLLPTRSKDLLKILTKNLRHPKVGTNTALGIEHVRKMMRAEGRSFAPKIIVVITDGKSSSPAMTALQAKLAKAEGYILVAIGVGSAIFKKELQNIASDESKIFQVTNFKDLELIINSIRDLICQSITTTTSTTTTTTTPAPLITVTYPPGLVCDVPADVGFIIDGSKSISPADWPKGLNFISNLINNLFITPHAIHVGIVVYSTLVSATVPLAPFKPKPLLVALTQSLKQPRQGTNTALGIDTMRQMFRSSGSRPNAPKVMIIITDGKSTNPQDTKDQALRAKAEGATIITVGIGGTHLFKDEINTIATNGKAFEVADYQSLTQIIQQLRDLICSVITTTQPAPTTTPPLPPVLPPIPGCDVPAEIMFLTHGSENINDYNWNKNKDFLTNLVRNLFVGRQEHHVGYVVYSTSVGDSIGLDPYKDSFDLTNFANGLIHPGDGANTAIGLKKLRQVFNTQGRTNAPRIGIVITDQTSTDTEATKREAEQAKNDGIHLLSVGIGNGINPRELQTLSSGERFISRVSSFDGLEALMPQVRQLICEVITRPTDFTELCSGCLVDKGSGFNPYPGDCTKYVQCWKEQNRVMGAIKSCAFGQFWDRNAMACKPSLNVQCPADKCRHSPDGFTYGMPGQGCRSYWLCVNGHSVGSCCATGTYYVEGMGCMRGMACKQPCPPDGGILVTPDCSKDEHWDQRYYIENVPQYGKVVRPCSPGTVYSKRYCACIVNENGLFPILPGDKCRVDAHFNFDVDLKDKSGALVPTSYIDVRRTRYGTAHFYGGNSEMKLWKDLNLDFGNQFVIRFKFKLDRWTDRFDYGGVIVDMGKGGDVQWMYDVESGWTRNITVGGGWDIRNLVKIFRTLIDSKSEAQMQQSMWKIANSIDFKTLLYQLGFVPDTSNGMQILRLLINGNGANFLRQIIMALEKQNTPFNMRLTLREMLSRPEFRTWIIQNVGSDNIEITMRNWKRFLESLLIPESDWKTGQIEWTTPTDQIGTGTMSSIAIIADLWRTFVHTMGMDGRDWQDLLKITLGTGIIGDGGRLDIDFINEMKNVLGSNDTIMRNWHNFLSGKNINLVFDTSNPIAKWWQKYFGVSSSVNAIPGIDNAQSVGIIADLWRKFVEEAKLPFEELGPKLTWTLGGPDATEDDLFKEIKAVLGDNNTKQKWLNFITAHYSNGGPGQTHSKLWKPGPKGELFWNLIFGQGGGSSQPGTGGEASVGITKLADLWRTFITQMNLKGPQWDKLLTWSRTFKPGSKIDVKALLHEIKSVLMGNDKIDSEWMKFLTNNGIDASWFVRVLFSDQGGPFDENWVYWYLYRHKDYTGTGNTTVTRPTDRTKIIRLWRDFIRQLRLGPEWNGMLVWTLGSGSQGGEGEYIEWIYEVIALLGNPTMRNNWMNFLNANNIGSEWINWFRVISGDTGTTGTTADNSGLPFIMNIWTKFIGGLNLTGKNWAKILIWSLGGGRTDRYIDWSNEVVGVLQNATIRDMWFRYLNQHDVGGVWLNWFRMILDVGSSTSSSGGWLWHYISSGLSVPLDILANLWIQFVYDRNLGYGQWADSLWWTLNVIPGALNQEEYLHLFNEMTVLMMDEYIRNQWIAFLHGHDITASWGGGIATTGGTSSESLDAILNSLGGGGGTSSSGSYGYGGSSSGGSDFFWPVEWDFDGGFSRKKRSLRTRSKRAVIDKMAHVALLSNCNNNNVKPSVSVTANEKNVKLSLTVQGRKPTELEVPLTQGWNEVTMAYDGKNMHGLVQNWQGKQHRKTPLSGYIEQRRGLTFGACDNYPRFKGQLDDIIVYKCVPESLKRDLV